MNLGRLFVAVLGLSAILAGTVAAEPPYSPKRPKEPLGNNPHPIIWGGGQTKTTTPPPAPPSQPARPTFQQHCHHRHTSINPAYCVDVRYLNFLNSLWRAMPYYYGGYYSYPSYAFPQVAPRPATQPCKPPVQAQAVERATNAQAVDRAQKFIGYGDALFVKGKYAQANGRYRDATQAAPQLADAQFRQAFALAATGRYELAVRAIQRGLVLDQRWPVETGFSLDVLFADNEAAKSERLESLVAAAEKKPQDANLQFLIGVHLYFDGQAAQALPFLRAAANLSGAHAPYVAAFL